MTPTFPLENRENMRFPWSKKRIEEIVDLRLLGSSAWKDVDDRIKQWTRIIAEEGNRAAKFRSEVAELRKLVNTLNEMQITFDVESQIEHIVQNTGIKLRCQSEARRIVGTKGIRMCIGKDIYIVTLPDNDSYAPLMVRPNCHYFLIGVKFLSTRPYGKYNIYEGRGIIRQRTFLKQRGNQPPITLFPYELHEDYVFSIQREEGKGALRTALIGYSARPETLSAMSALMQG